MAATRPPAWRTEAAIAELRRLRADGLGSAEVAKRLAITVRQLDCFVRRFGAPRGGRPAGAASWKTDATIDRLRQMWGDGVSMADCARRLGLTKGQISGAVHRHGMTRRPGAPPPAFTPPPRLAAPKPPGAVRPAAPKTPTPRPPLAAASAAAPGRPAVFAGPPGACCWVLGDPAPGRVRTCDRPTPSRRAPYCDEHAQLAYLPRPGARAEAGVATGRDAS